MKQVAVEVETGEYEAAHGCRPRGRGSWAFRVEATAVSWNSVKQELVWVNGTYQEAVREAKKVAREWVASRTEVLALYVIVQS